MHDLALNWSSGVKLGRRSCSSPLMFLLWSVPSTLLQMTMRDGKNATKTLRSGLFLYPYWRHFRLSLTLPLGFWSGEISETVGQRLLIKVSFSSHFYLTKSLTLIQSNMSFKRKLRRPSVSCSIWAWSWTWVWWPRPFSLSTCCLMQRIRVARHQRLGHRWVYSLECSYLESHTFWSYLSSSFAASLAISAAIVAAASGGWSAPTDFQARASPVCTQTGPGASGQSAGTTFVNQTSSCWTPKRHTSSHTAQSASCSMSGVKMWLFYLANSTDSRSWAPAWIRGRLILTCWIRLLALAQMHRYKRLRLRRL